MATARSSPSPPLPPRAPARPGQLRGLEMEIGRPHQDFGGGMGHHDVRVNAVAPNRVETPMIRDAIPTAFLEGVMLDRTPLGRLAQPAEIASARAR